MDFKLLVFSFITYFVTHVVSTEYETKFVAVVFRHGDRTPENDEIYPTDPYLHDDFHPLGRGQLTITGKQREYKLGQVLRDLYNDFLGDIYYSKDITARSTAVDRTRMSLQLVLSALYPPKGSQLWNESLYWQPILTSYVQERDDTLLKPELCPLYIKEYEKLQRSPELQSEIAKFEPLMQNLTLETGKKISTMRDIFLLYNGFTALMSMNRSLPKWSEEIFPHGLLIDGANLEYKSLFYNDKLKRLRSGMVFRNITNTMKGIVDGKLKTHQKMSIFSGHDANVASLLAIFSDYSAHVPKYSSSVNVELLHKNNSYFVRVRHYLGIPASVVDLKVPGCDIICPFNDFIKLMTKFIPSDEEAKCDKKSNPHNSEIFINY